MSILDRIIEEIDNGKLALFNNPDRKTWYTSVPNEYIASIKRARDILVKNNVTTKPLSDLVEDLRVGKIAYRKDYDSTIAVGKYNISRNDLNELKSMLDLDNVQDENVTRNNSGDLPLQVSERGVIKRTNGEPVFLSEEAANRYYMFKDIKEAVENALGNGSISTGTYSVQHKNINNGKAFDIFVWVDSEDNNHDRNGSVWIQLLDIGKDVENAVKGYWYPKSTGVAPLSSGNGHIEINRFLMALRCEEMRFISYKDTGNVYDITNKNNRGVDFIHGTRKDHKSFLEAISDVNNGFNLWKDYYRYGMRFHGTRDPIKGYKNVYYEYMRIWDNSNSFIKILYIDNKHTRPQSTDDTKFTTIMNSDAYSGQDTSSSQSYGGDDNVISHWNIGNSTQSTATNTIQFQHYRGAVFLRYKGVNECV